jgi:hypothetical protein
MLFELDDRLLERLTLPGSLTHLTQEQPIDGAETIWLRTIYGTDQP